VNLGGERVTFLSWLKGYDHNISELTKRYFKIMNFENILFAVNTFIYAGLSALLLLLSNLYSTLWFLSFFALIPLLIRGFRSNKAESILLGTLFGLIYFTINSLQLIDGHLIAIFTKILIGTLLSAGFVYSIYFIKKNFGLNPVFISILWIAFEFVLIKLGFINDLLGGEVLSQRYFYGISTLFGFLIISLIIVIINALLIIAVNRFMCWAKSRQAQMPVGERTWNLYTKVGFFADNFYLSPDNRGPPICSSSN